MRIAIFGNPSQSRHSERQRALFALLSSLEDEVLVEKSYLDFLTGQMKWDIPFQAAICDDNFTADIVVSIGGDGTFLRTAMRIGDKCIPMLGITDSLNVSVSAAILLYEALRQRRSR